MTFIRGSLSRRGTELADVEDYRDKFKAILSNLYDPVKNPTGYVNFGTSQNYAMLDEVRDFSNKQLKLESRDFTYGEGPWGSDRIREATTQHINRFFKPNTPVRPGDLVFASGVTSLCEMLGWAICDPGDCILLTRPSYQSFPPDFGTKAKVKSQFVDFGSTDQFSPECIPDYESAIQKALRVGQNPRAIVLCNPHNPLGKCYPLDTITGLMSLCNKYDLHLISDEVYALSVYDVSLDRAVPFTSVLSIPEDKYMDKDMVHVLYSMSKDFAAAGIHIGMLHSRNQRLLRALNTMTPYHRTGLVNEKIACEILENKDWLDGFIALSRQRLAKSNMLVKRVLDEHQVPYCGGTNAGFFIWADFSKFLGDYGDRLEEGWRREDELIKAAIAHKVYIPPGRILAAERPGFSRIVSSQDERVVTEGLKRVFEAAGSLKF